MSSKFVGCLTTLCELPKRVEHEKLTNEIFIRELLFANGNFVCLICHVLLYVPAGLCNVSSRGINTEIARNIWPSDVDSQTTFQWFFFSNSKYVNSFKNVVCKIAAILFRPLCDNQIDWDYNELQDLGARIFSMWWYDCLPWKMEIGKARQSKLNRPTYQPSLLPNSASCLRPISRHRCNVCILMPQLWNILIKMNIYYNKDKHVVIKTIFGSK